MNQGMIALRYSRALLDASRDAGVADQVYRDLQLLSQIRSEVPAFDSFFAQDRTLPSKKIELLKVNLFPLLQPLTRSFLELIVEKRREAFLGTMIRSFGRQYKQWKGISDILVTISTPADLSVKEHWTTVLKEIMGNQIEVAVQQDPDIIEGFSLQIDHQLYDATVKSSLQAMQKALSERVPLFIQ